jgi:hypothetical protein
MVASFQARTGRGADAAAPSDALAGSLDAGAASDRASTKS